jgi:hypothetical protein
MPKSEADFNPNMSNKNLSKISEEHPSSSGDTVGYTRQRDQVDILMAMYQDDFILYDEPSDT